MAQAVKQVLQAAASQVSTSEGAGTIISGQNIICFAKDWGEDPTSCNHVLRELAKTNKVLWLNSISTRAPKLTSGRDLGKIWKKLASFLKGSTRVQESMWVYTPIVLPFHYSKAAIVFNRILLRLALAVLCRKLGMRKYQLWTFVPTSVHYVGALKSELLVYYVTDNWSAFTYVDGEKIGAMVEDLAGSADIVFATSRPLVEKLRKNNSATYLAEHGVNYADFALATKDTTAIPSDLKCLIQPVLGFYGLIEEWLDQDLLAYLAERHPEWTIALVGRVCVDVSRLERYSNIHFLGRKPHAELPNYCKGFSVALIPHLVNELTIHMNPIKLREYMSAGLPIVSTALPEVRQYPDHCTVAENYEEFEQSVALALQHDSPVRRIQRSQTMKHETWECKVALLSEIVLETRNRQNVELRN